MTDEPANTTPRRFSRPRPRLRKAAKWVTLILSIMLAALWAASPRLGIGYVWTHKVCASVSRNGLYLGWVERSSRSRSHGEWYFFEPPPYDERWLEVYRQGGWWNLTIPFWAITLPTIALTVFAWRRDAAARRRALHNHCPGCGHDRAGLLTPDAVCPECGAAAPMPAPAT